MLPRSHPNPTTTKHFSFAQVAQSQTRRRRGRMKGKWRKNERKEPISLSLYHLLPLDEKEYLSLRGPHNDTTEVTLSHARRVQVGCPYRHATRSQTSTTIPRTGGRTSCRKWDQARIRSARADRSLDDRELPRIRERLARRKSTPGAIHFRSGRVAAGYEFLSFASDPPILPSVRVQDAPRKISIEPHASARRRL